MSTRPFPYLGMGYFVHGCFPLSRRYWVLMEHSPLVMGRWGETKEMVGSGNLTGSSGVPLGSVADLVVGYLAALGVEYVFGIPGGGIEPLYDALARSAQRGGPRAVVARHESGAAFMADGYARASGRLGVCCATTGPGATNLITGVASAFSNHIPLLVITAQSLLAGFGRGAFQESSCDAVNTVGMLSHCTVYNTLVSHPAQAEVKLLQAIMSAMGSTTGPAHISVPADVFRAPHGPHPDIDLDSFLPHRPSVDREMVDTLWDWLKEPGEVVIVVGEECAGAAQEIQQFAELRGAALVTTPGGKGWVDTHSPCYLGVLGFAGHDSARAAVMHEQVRHVIVAGSALGEWDAVGEAGKRLAGEGVIHIDPVQKHFVRSPLARLHLAGDIAAVFARLARLAAEETARFSGGWLETLARPGGVSAAALAHKEEGGLHPEILMQRLAERLPATTRFLADTGNSFVWATHSLNLCGAGRLHQEMRFGAMGWAIGAAVGMALGGEGEPVVCITGDGSCLMNGQELTVALELGLPVIFVVLNDAALGMVKHGQRIRGAARIGYQLPVVDFAAMARAMGIRGLSVSSLSELDGIDWPAVCESGGPTLVDVRIDGEVEPPIQARAAALGT